MLQTATGLIVAPDPQLLPARHLSQLLALAATREILSPIPMPAEVLAQLDSTIDHTESKLMPAADEQISAACTQVLRLIGQGMTSEEKQEWIDAIMYQFGNCPGNLLVEAIIESGGRAHGIREMSRLITDYLGDSQETLAQRLLKLRKVREAAIVAA